MGIKLQAGSKFSGGVSISTPSPYDDILDEDSGWVTVSTFSSQDGDPDFEYIQNSSGGTVSYNKADHNGLTTIKGGMESPSTYSEFNPTKVATKQITGLVVGQPYTIDVTGTFGIENNNAHSYAKIVVGVTPSNTTGLFRWADISPLLEAHHISETPNPSGGNGVGSLASTSTVEFVATSSTYTVVASKNSSGSGSDFSIEKMDINMVAASAPSAPTPNKILMYTPDNMYNSAINTIRGGLRMSDVDGSNPITLQTLTPQSSAGGDGKVVSIARSNSEIRIYDQTTGQLEQTFNDATVDSAMAAQINETASQIAIGAGKIFINAAEYYPNGLGAIIVVDLLDRNVPTYVITPVVSGTYSRIGGYNYGGIRFIEGRIYAGSAPWSASDRGIHGFDVDGSNQSFIPTSNGTHSFVKYGDNWAWSNGDDGVTIVSSTGQVLHSAKVSAQFGYHLETTLSGKLVVVDHTQFNSKVYIYDEGLTNQVVISGDQQANDDLWGDGSVTNRAGMAVFGNDILVSAKSADANGLTNCGAVYRYNDSGVLQDIVYGTVNQQMLGQRIEVAY